MDRKRLNQYKALQREIPKLKKDIQKLEEKLSQVPVVAGKVTKSSDEFPFIEEHVSVKMEEPKAATEIKKQIRLKEQRMEQAERDKTEIEQFINEIEDSNDRLIFDMVYLQGMSVQKVADEIGYTKGRISQKVTGILKD